MRQSSHGLQKVNLFYILSAFIVVAYTGGIVTHLVAEFRAFALQITELVLLITNTAVLLYIFKKNPNRALAIWILVAYLLTFSLEALGVATAKVFGSYTYGATMQVKLFGVPLIIAFNWVMLVLGTYSYALILKINRWFIPFISSIIIVAFDYVMEPVAMYLDYWQWKDDVIPLQNYMAWFSIALILSFYLSGIKVKLPHFVLRLYVLMQFLFFLSLNLLLE